MLADGGLGIAAEEHAVRQDAGAFAGALERAQDVQQVGVVALLGRRRAVGWKRSIRVVVLGVEAGAPALVAEGRIGDDVVEGLELPSPSVKSGLASVLPCLISAVALSCRIMFMRARPAVAVSFSCP